jgi:hypothetical protein
LELIVAVVFESSLEGAVHADEELEDKQKRKVMSLLDKVEVLVKLDRGMRNSTVGRRYDVNKSIVHFIKKNEDKFGGALRPVFHRVRKFRV